MRALLIPVLTIVLSTPALAGTEPPRPLRFAFRPGETLTYAIRQEVSFPGKDGGYTASLEGQCTFGVKRVRPDGQAEIEVTASGRGTLGSGTEAVPFDTEAPQPITLLVAPTGVVSEIRDAAGKKSSLITDDGEDLLNASRLLRSHACGTYTLFGLQLPNKPVADGKAWNGVHRSETARFEGDAADLDPRKATVTLTSRAVRFTSTGTDTVQGRPCRVITCASALHLDQPGVQQDLPGKYWFDDQSGQLLKAEIQAKDLGERKGRVSYTVTLVSRGT